MKKDAFTSQIDDYLTNSLSGNELLEFEKMIKHDNELAKELHFQEEVFEAIRDERKREIRETLNQIHRKSTNKPRINIYSWKLQAVAAAVVVLLVSGGLIGNFFANKPINETLYSQYFNPESSLLSVRSQGTFNSKVKEGMYYYEQGKFTEAISVFHSEPNNLLGKLYTGFSFMKLEKFERAESPFIEIIDNKDNLFVDQAEWNLGLCYLKSGKTTKAQSLFARISAGNTVYNKNANKILNELDQK